MIWLIAAITAGATLLGGFVAIRFKDRLHLILGFSAGSVLAVAFFDLLPEAFQIGNSFYPATTICLALAGGFVAYLLLDRINMLQPCDDEHHLPHHHGTLGASSLSLHSFLDGFAIGIGFQLSAAIGTIIAVGVILHDFSDGMNTVTLATRGQANARRWLIIDALAPVIGVGVSMITKIPEQMFSIVLAIFCGFFLYIGASDLLPESHHNHPTRWTTLSTLLGMALLYIAIRLVQ